jgi:putative heme iron utilization protein
MFLSSSTSAIVFAKNLSPQGRYRPSLGNDTPSAQYLFLQIWRCGGEQKGQGMNETVDRGQLCRRLMRRQAHGVLATSLAQGAQNQPYASLVALACDHDVSPLLLLSDLAQHSRNIAADHRISLLFDGGGEVAPGVDPLAQPRLSLLGEAVRSDEPSLLERFVGRHPSAGAYAGFGDFHLYRVTIGRGHLVAGFGRISWVEADELRFSADPQALTAAETGIVAHMNADHADAIDLYATRLLRRTSGGWRMTGIDPEGIDLRREHETARLDFTAPVLDPLTARKALVALAAEARAAVPP